MLEGIKVGQKSAENEIMPGKSDEWHLAIWMKQKKGEKFYLKSFMHK
jgi:hypothetical protein